MRKVVVMMLAAAVGFGVAGCQRPLRIVPEPSRLEVADGLDPRFAAGRELLSGFDAIEAGSAWAPGDSVLLGIAMDSPGRSQEWYLKVTVVGKLGEIKTEHSTFNFRDEVRVRYAAEEPGKKGRWVRVGYDLVMLEVQLFDGKGGLLFESMSFMPEICLQYGLIDSIELERAGRKFYDDLPLPEDGSDAIAGEEQKRMLAGWVALMRLPQFLHRDSMQGLVWEIIERPSLLSMALAGGVSMALGMKGEHAEMVDPPPLGPGPVYRVPLQVQVNDREALECTLLLARAAPPLGPANGLLGMDAVNPKDGRKRMAVRLLAARRNQVPAWFTRNAVTPPSTPPGAEATAPPAGAFPGDSGP